MGLASYGKPGPLLDTMREVILLEPHGRIRIDRDAMNFWLGEYVLEDPVALRRLSTSFLKKFGPGRKFFEAHLLCASVAQNGVAVCRLYVADPRHVGAEHRNQVSLALDRCHHERKGDRAARPPSGHLERDQVAWSNAPRVKGGPAAVERTRQRVRPVPAVEPPLEALVGHLALRRS
jgi:hypothetical protein